MGTQQKSNYHLPFVEQDIQDLDARIFAPFETHLLVRTAAAVGVKTSDALADSNIHESHLDDATTRISARQRLRVYQNISRECADPSVFLRAGNTATICSFGVWGYVLMSSNSFLDAIHIAFKYLGLTGPLIRKTFDIDGKTAFFEAKDTLALGVMLPAVIEFWYAFITKLCKEVSQRAFVLQRLELNYPAPAHHAYYEELFGCEVSFDAGKNRMCFSTDILGMELPRADALSFQICDEMCASLLEEMKNFTGPAKEVRELILYQPNYFPSFEEIAKRLYTTPRTLRRRLADQGTSYQQIMNDVRKNLAIKFLRETNLSMEEIAERVGFSDSRNFRHAFKKWTDSTPSSHRMRH